MRAILIIPSIILILASLEARAAEMSISQSIDKMTVAFDEHATLTIELRWDGPQHEYYFDRPLQPVLDRFQIAKFSTSLSTDPSATAQQTKKIFRYELQPTSAGVGKIEPITISYIRVTDSIPGQLSTEPISLTITEPTAATRPRTPELMSKPALIIAGVTLVLSISFTVVLIARSRRPREKPLTPAQEVLRRLGELRESANGEPKTFQSGLYKLLVWYLHKQHGMDVSPRPTEDIIHSIDNSTIPHEQKEKIGAWLLQAHRTKFSPVQASPGEVTRLEAEVRQFFETVR